MGKRKLVIVYSVLAPFLLLVALFSQQIASGQAGAFSTQPVTTMILPTDHLAVTFTATMVLSPSQRELALGETLTMSVRVDYTEGCQYPIIELILTQTGPDAPIFSYVSPPTSTYSGPAHNPYTYTLTAVSPGTVRFHGRTFGERYCNDFWNWYYVHGDSEFIRVGDWPSQSYLPMMSR